MDAVVGLVQSGVDSVLFSEVVASIASVVAAEVDVEKQVRPSMIVFVSAIAAAVVAEVTFAKSAHFAMIQVVENLMLQLMLFLTSLDQLPSVEIVRLAALAVASFVHGQNVVEHHME